MSQEALPSDAKRGRFEPIVAILMALTTLATAWCSFQSSRWSGRSSESSTQADKLQRNAAAMHLESQQIEDAHLHLVTQAIDARLQGNDKLVQFYTERMGGELKPAWDKWLALQPFDNPSAPPHPFVPEIYKSRFTDEIKRDLNEAGEAAARANTADTHAGNYLRLTVLWALVLFFAGTAKTFDSARVQRSSIAFATALWAYACVRMLMEPTL